MIILIQYPTPNSAKVLNYSPFCAKLEFFLMVNQIEYKIDSFAGNPKSTPNGKLPYIEYQNEKITDSSEIISFLSQEMKIDMDSNLTSEQKAHSFAARKMVEEYLYWVLIYSRWIDESNWSKTKITYFGHLPPIIRSIVPALVRKDVKKSAFYHGMGRHDKQEVYNIGKECLSQLSNLLGSKKYFFGDKISLLDITIFGFLSNIVFDLNTNSSIQLLIKSYPNLVNYITQVDEEIVKKSKILRQS